MRILIGGVHVRVRYTYVGIRVRGGVRVGDRD